MSGLTVDVTDELLETIAAKAAELVAASSTGQETTGYLDVSGAADYLACKPSRIYALVSAKRIPHHKDGSRLLFDRAELRAYVEAGGAVRP